MCCNPPPVIPDRNEESVSSVFRRKSRSLASVRDGNDIVGAFSSACYGRASSQDLAGSWHPVPSGSRERRTIAAVNPWPVRVRTRYILRRLHLRLFTVGPWRATSEQR